MGWFIDDLQIEGLAPPRLRFLEPDADDDGDGFDNRTEVEREGDPLDFAVWPRPVLDSITPARGGTQGGGTVTVRGGPFRGPDNSTGLLVEVFSFLSSPDRLPDLTGLAPDFVALEPAIDHYPYTAGPFPGTQFADNFAVRWTGSLDIEDEGAYTLILGSDDGSRLWLDGKLLIDNDGPHSFTEKSADAVLRSGLHDLRVEVFEAGGDFGARLQLDPPGEGRARGGPSGEAADDGGQRLLFGGKQAVFQAVSIDAALAVLPAGSPGAVDVVLRTSTAGRPCCRAASPT